MKGTDINRTYPRDIPDLFEGGQLVWVGRYTDPGKVRVRLKGKVGDDKADYSFDADLADSGEGRRFAFVERLWAIRRIGDILDQIDLNGQNKELVDELVALSRQHGILTPYTSFLADEGTDLQAGVQLNRRASESLEMLGQETRSLGVGQRLAKQNYRMAERGLDSFAAMPAEPAAAAASGPVPGLASRAPGRPNVSGRTMGGMGGGFGGMGGSSPGQSAVARDAEGRDRAVETVRNVGRKTFYLRDGVWIDAEVKAEQIPQARRVVQFTAEYFALAAGQAQEDNQYLTFRRPVVILLDDQVYRIDPPAKR